MKLTIAELRLMAMTLRKLSQRPGSDGAYLYHSDARRRGWSAVLAKVEAEVAARRGPRPEGEG